MQCKMTTQDDMHEESLIIISKIDILSSIFGTKKNVHIRYSRCSSQTTNHYLEMYAEKLFHVFIEWIKLLIYLVFLFIYLIDWLTDCFC